MEFKGDDQSTSRDGLPAGTSDGDVMEENSVDGRIQPEAVLPTLGIT